MSFFKIILTFFFLANLTLFINSINAQVGLEDLEKAFNKSQGVTDNKVDKTYDNLQDNEFNQSHKNLKPLGQSTNSVENNYDCDSNNLSQEQIVECEFKIEQKVKQKEVELKQKEVEQSQKELQRNQMKKWSQEEVKKINEGDWTKGYSQEIISENLNFLNNLTFSDVDRLIGNKLRKKGDDLSNKNLFCEGTKKYLNVYKFKAQKFIEFKTYNSAIITDITLTDKSDWSSRGIDAYFFNPSKDKNEFYYNIGGETDGIRREKIILYKKNENQDFIVPSSKEGSEKRFQNRKQVLAYCLEKDAYLNQFSKKFDRELSDSAFGCYQDIVYKSNFSADKTIDRTTLKMKAGIINKFLFGIFGTDTTNFSCKISDQSFKKLIVKQYNQLKEDYDKFINDRKEEDKSNYKI